jgi:hypothetical protein
MNLTESVGNWYAIRPVTEETPISSRIQMGSTRVDSLS